MRRLYLMRHGHSPAAGEAGVDQDALRPLSPRGRRDAARMARELARRGARPELVLHSPLLRAAQTARIAAQTLEAPAGAEAFALLDNTRPAAEVIAALGRRAAGADEVLAVGHQPQLGEIAALLARALVDIRPGGLVALEAGPAPGLLWSLNPEELP
ncbi:MAG: histidine phosphatase family protein [Elusimicrobia bacterium]|nr:histidine phosphatase family protein [Elusimicrobiota bacterium]